tara:strand:- start:231 stop:425 length:195 start_codon:yes stop_codon:yes gene_type:complete
MTEENDQRSIEEVPTTEPGNAPGPVDVDSSWDGKGSLDDHRQQEFEKTKQPGFGDAGKAKLNGE